MVALGAACCAGVFLGVKAIEYTHKWHDGLFWRGIPLHRRHDAGHGSSHDAGHEASHDAAKKPGVDDEAWKGHPPRNVGIFFSIYFFMTGLHGLHVVVGMGLLAWLMIRAAKGHFGPQHYGPVDFVGLYWPWSIWCGFISFRCCI